MNYWAGKPKMVQSMRMGRQSNHSTGAHWLFRMRTNLVGLFYTC